MLGSSHCWWGLKTGLWWMVQQITVFFDVLTAAVDHPGHLAVDGIEAQPFVPVLLLLTRRFGRQRELQRLQQAGLVVIQVCDGVHWHATLEVIGIAGSVSLKHTYFPILHLRPESGISHPPACPGCCLRRVGGWLVGGLGCGTQRGVAAG